MTTIGVNLLWCVPGRVGGSEEYVTRALAPLDEVAPDVRPVLFVLPGLATAHPALAGRYELVTAPLTGRRRSLRVVAERTWLAREAARRRLPLVHHAGGTAPPLPRASADVVLSMHDIQYVAFPHYFTRLKLEWLRREVPAGLARATVITAPSEFVRGTLDAELGVAPERVQVVPHGLPAGFATGPVDEDALRARYHLHGPFLLYPAATYPHKNHLLLLDVLARLRDRPELQLVLTGGPGLGEEGVVRAINQRGLRDRVRRTGRVPDRDRDGLLRCADALVFPSRYEGFGQPVLEALACACPVACSDLPPLREVAGDAAVYFDPDDPESIAAGVREAIARGGASGPARAAQFSWDETARRHDAVYRELAT
jgi:glycosyltransferase involved in cell wall biosynthesis